MPGYYIDYCCEACGNPMKNLELDLDRIDDERNTSILTERFCPNCGNELTAANKFSDMYVSKMRTAEKDIELENNALHSEMEMAERRKTEKEKNIEAEIKKLKSEKSVVEGNIKELEKEKEAIRKKIEAIRKDNIALATQTELYEEKSKEIKKVSIEQSNDPKEVLRGLSGIEWYNKLAELNVGSAVIDVDEELMAGEKNLRELNLKYTSNAIFEGTGEGKGGIRCFVDMLDEKYISGGEAYDLFELYPMPVTGDDAESYSKFYEYSCEGDGECIQIERLCRIWKMSSTQAFYNVYQKGRIVFK